MKHCAVMLCLALAACSEPAPLASAPPLVDAPIQDGRWQVINYWAIWCGPCRDEVPELNRFAERHADRVAVYAVNFDRMLGEELHVQATELGIGFPLLTKDPAPVLGYAPPTVLPTTLVIAPDGRVTGRLVGPQTEATLEAALQ